MQVEDLLRRYPCVFHIAQAGSWPSLAKHGLLSTAALCDLFEVPADDRERLMGRRRESSHVLEHPIHGRAVVRDNLPLSEDKLAAALEDMRVEEWLQLLNRKVFFWPTEARLRQMLNARAYRAHSHDVVVDVACLVGRYGDGISLSLINSGSTLYTPARRGSRTFCRLSDYAFEERCRRRPPLPIAEFAVDWAVPDLTGVTLRVERRRADAIVGVV